MTKNVIKFQDTLQTNHVNFLKKIFLWTKAMDKRLVYNKLKEYLPVQNVQVLDNDRIVLNFGEFNDQKISLLLEFVWENNTLVDIRNCN